MIALQKKNDLESFPIQRGESEQDQSTPKAPLRDLGAARVFELCFSPAIMSSNPAAPINLVKEPVHDHQQNDDSQESGRGLEIERRHVVAERTDDAHCDKPGDQAGDKSEACAERDRLAMHAFGPR